MWGERRYKSDVWEKGQRFRTSNSNYWSFKEFSSTPSRFPGDFTTTEPSLMPWCVIQHQGSWIGRISLVGICQKVLFPNAKKRYKKACSRLRSWEVARPGSLSAVWRSWLRRRFAHFRSSVAIGPPTAKSASRCKIPTAHGTSDLRGMFGFSSCF